jgi:hypothetical protein
MRADRQMDDRRVAACELERTRVRVSRHWCAARLVGCGVSSPGAGERAKPNERPKEVVGRANRKNCGSDDTDFEAFFLLQKHPLITIVTTGHRGGTSEHATIAAEFNGLLSDIRRTSHAKMPLKTSATSINFIFNLVELLKVSQRWFTVKSGLLLDGHSVLVLMLCGCGTMACMFKAIRDREKGAQQENLLLTLWQRLFLGWTMVYLHVFHSTFLDSPAASIFVALAALVCTHLLLEQLTVRGLLPPRLLTSLRSFWSRFLFLLPSDALESVWLTSGYVLTRWIFPHTVGRREAVWGGERLDGVDRCSGELCPYTYRGSSSDSLGLRACMDLSGLCVVFAGILWPAMEFGRVVVVRCATMMGGDAATEGDKAISPSSSSASATPDAAPAAASKDEKTKGGKKVSKEEVKHAANAAAAAPPDARAANHHGADSSDDESSHGHSHGPLFNASESSLLARTLAFTNMAAVSMFVTWLYGIGMLAMAHHHSTILSAQTTSCPYLQTPAYNRDVRILAETCPSQWSSLQNIAMFGYISTGLLSAIFAFVTNPLPPGFRIQFFVVLAMSLWKGSILPNCQIISEACIAAAQVDAKDY